MALVIAPLREWWSLVLLVALFATACVVVVPRYWRGDTGHARSGHPPGLWPFGVPSWKGFLRALPAISALMLLVSVGFLIPAMFMGATASTPWRIYGLIVVAYLYFVAVLAVSIVVFNRPRHFVPPPWREDPGAMSAWSRRGGR